MKLKVKLDCKLVLLWKAGYLWNIWKMFHKTTFKDTINITHDADKTAEVMYLILTQQNTVIPHPWSQCPLLFPKHTALLHFFHHFLLELTETKMVTVNWEEEYESQQWSLWIHSSVWGYKGEKHYLSLLFQSEIRSNKMNIGRRKNKNPG